MGKIREQIETEMRTEKWLETNFSLNNDRQNSITHFFLLKWTFQQLGDFQKEHMV